MDIKIGNIPRIYPIFTCIIGELPKSPWHVFGNCVNRQTDTPMPMKNKLSVGGGNGVSNWYSKWRKNLMQKILKSSYINPAYTSWKIWGYLSILGKATFTVRMLWWATPTDFVDINRRAPLHGKVLRDVLEFVMFAGIVLQPPIWKFTH